MHRKDASTAVVALSAWRSRVLATHVSLGQRLPAEPQLCLLLKPAEPQLQAACTCRWVWYDNGQRLHTSAPLNVTLTGASGAVRTAMLSELDGGVELDLGVQF